MSRILIALAFITALVLPLSAKEDSRSLISIGTEALAEKIVVAFKENVSAVNKNNIAIFKFKESGEEAKAKEIGTVIASILTTELNKTGEFDVIDRENVEKAYAEMEMAMSGLIDETKDTVEIGKMVAANMFLNGEITEVEGNYIVNVKMTDVETSEVVLTESVEFPKDKMNSMSTLLLTEVKYPITAGFRSAVVPGWGQFYNDRPVIGGITLGLSLAAGGSAIAFGVLKSIAERDMQYYRQQYDSHASWDTGDLAANQALAEEYYDNMSLAYDDAVFYGDITMYSLMGLGAVWVFGVFQGAIDATIRLKNIEKAQKDLSASSGISSANLALYPSLDPIGKNYSLAITLKY